MPVSVNEPLSFLQRMMEYLEYAELLVAASQTDDPVHRLEVCLFARRCTRIVPNDLY